MAQTNHLEPAGRMQSLPPSFFSGLHQRIQQLKADGVDLIRMDMGSPDMPPPRFVLDALKRSADEPSHHGYTPFGGLPVYRAAWAEFYGRRFGVELDPDNELTGLMGSKEGVFKLALAYVNPGEVVLVPDPGYGTYTAGALFAGAEVVYFPLTAASGFLPDFRRIPLEVLRRTKLLWLNYPNNPTGAVAPLEMFVEAVALAREHGFLLAHDAPYTEITFDGVRAPSVLQVPHAKDIAVEFHSLSKTGNMAGWRVGVLAGNAGVVRTMNAMQSNIDSGGFQPILDAAAEALTGDAAWMVERNKLYRERRDLVVAGVRAAGLKAEMPAGAIYVWAQLPAGVTDDQYSQALLDGAGVSVTPGRIFGPSGTAFIRISLSTPTERVREAMQRWQTWAKSASAPSGIRHG